MIVGSSARLESLVGPLPNPEFRETLLHYIRCMQKAGRRRAITGGVSRNDTERFGLAGNGRKR